MNCSNDGLAGFAGLAGFLNQLSFAFLCLNCHGYEVWRFSLAFSTAQAARHFWDVSSAWIDCARRRESLNAHLHLVPSAWNCFTWLWSRLCLSVSLPLCLSVSLSLSSLSLSALFAIQSLAWVEVKECTVLLIYTGTVVLAFSGHISHLL